MGLKNFITMKFSTATKVVELQNGLPKVRRRLRIKTLKMPDFWLGALVLFANDFDILVLLLGFC